MGRVKNGHIEAALASAQEEVDKTAPPSLRVGMRLLLVRSYDPQCLPTTSPLTLRHSSITLGFWKCPISTPLRHLLQRVIWYF